MDGVDELDRMGSPRRFSKFGKILVCVNLRVAALYREEVGNI